MSDFWKILIGAVVSSAAGYGLWRVKRDRKSITYRHWVSQVFNLDDASYRSHTVEIRNAGNVAVTDIDVVIALEGVKLVEDPSVISELITDVRVVDERLRACIPLLNSGECTGVNLTTDDSELGEVSARTAGATAIADDGRRLKSSLMNVALAVILPLAFWMVFIALTFRFGDPVMSFLTGYPTSEERDREWEERQEELDREREERQEERDREWEEREEEARQRKQQYQKEEADRKAQALLRRQAPDTELLLWTAFGAAELQDEYWKLVGSRSGRLRFLDAALWVRRMVELEPTLADGGAKVLGRLSAESSMSESSLTTVYFVLAKIEARRGNHDVAAKHFRRCEELAPATYAVLTSR